MFGVKERERKRRGKGGKERSGQLQKHEADRGIAQQGIHKPLSITEGKAQSREGWETRLSGLRS